jgi:hypothetical protein
MSALPMMVKGYRSSDCLEFSADPEPHSSVRVLPGAPSETDHSGNSEAWSLLRSQGRNCVRLSKTKDVSEGVT